MSSKLKCGVVTKRGGVKTAVVEMAALEPRVLFAQTPAAPRPGTLGAAFDGSERAVLLARLNNLPGDTYTLLQNNLDQKKIGAFDENLLAYMDSRSYGQFHWDHHDTGDYVSYIADRYGSGFAAGQADSVTDARKFPEQSAESDYSVQLPADVTWNGLGKSSNPEFIHALNRHDWWTNLAESYRLTDDTKYSQELSYELADWSAENPTNDAPAGWAQNDKDAWFFDTAIRADAWLWSYQTMLGSPGWSGADNSLMLYKLVQQGDYLYANAGQNTNYASNRTFSVGRTLTELALVLPEVDKTADWQVAGNAVVFRSMDAQLYDDGSHVEQSPGYTDNLIGDLVEFRQLETFNGADWPDVYQLGGGKTIQPKLRLTNAVDSLWQTLSPNGQRPAIGDTYRKSSYGSFLKAELVQGETRWPDASAEPRDVWLFGPTTIDPYVNQPDPTSLGNRGTTYSLADSGNYILRSSNSSSARQINFDAGPKGGTHGHFDLLSFELSGYGKPLISDAGLYKYDDSASRNFAISTKAHNTIGVADLNTGWLEGAGNPSILTSGIQSVAGGYMISASHQGYQAIDGAPVVGRSLWFDGDATMVIVDFAEATVGRNFETGFLIPGTNTGRDLANGVIYSKNSSGNVRIETLLRPGQQAGYSTNGVFVSNSSSDVAAPATRFYVQALNTTYTAIATVITTGAGAGTAPPADVTWTTAPTAPGQSAVLNVNGTDITFAAPQFARTGQNGASRGTYNDIAYDAAGKLHAVWYDRDDDHLKYAVRTTSGVWSTIQTIDAGPFAGLYPSLDIDGNNRPGVAYFDGNNGDLRYAYLSADVNAWQVQTIDSAGSVGLYPSLSFSRNNGAVISYYNRTKGDLRLATAQTDGFAIQTLDSTGDVGRFSSLLLDPNRPDSSKYAVGYEDTTHASYKYAIQYRDTWRYDTIDQTMTIAGGYLDLSFYDSGTTSDRYKPAASYYDAGNTALKFAYKTGGTEQTVWKNETVNDKKVQGLYTQLYFEGAKPRVLYFDRTNNQALFAYSTGLGKGWSFSSLGTGGREIHISPFNGGYAYSSLDESVGLMKVYPL